jgi:hypothetical protein
VARETQESVLNESPEEVTFIDYDKMANDQEFIDKIENVENLFF